MADDSTAKEIARLVTHFGGVLETLNTNIFRYREKKAAEFTALYEEQLAGTDEPIAKEVRKAIKASIERFPELNGFTIDPVAPIQDMASNDRLSAHEQQQAASGPSVPPEPVVPVKSLEPSPTIHREERREHESDLTGVVIPGYLPLLDATKEEQPPGSDVLSEKPVERLSETPPPASTQTSPQFPPDPSTPQADTTSPTRSDSTRRSALRRSASASKSPRKVRFDIGAGGDDSDSGDRNPSPDYGEAVASGSGVPSSKFPPSMLDDPDEAPPPKKVSSVERLRKLGRHPYKSQEESDADAPVPINLDQIVRETVSKPDSTSSSSKQESKTPKHPPSGIGRLHMKDNPTIDLDEPEAIFAASPSDNDEGVLPEINVKKFKLMRSSSAQSSTQTSPTSPTGPSAPFSQPPPDPPTPQTAKEEHAEPIAEEKADIKATMPDLSEKVKLEQAENIADRPNNDDDDELFMFDDDDGISKPKPSPPPAEEDAIDEPEDERGEAAASESTKPAVPVAKGTQSTQSQASRSLLSDGIGSYKGHVLRMSVVKDPSVYAEAASLGDFNTFVGGIDGTSGMDEGDLNSFRASVAPLTTGSPKSFSERLLMEDARLAMRNEQRHNFGSLPVRSAQR